MAAALTDQRVERERALIEKRRFHRVLFRTRCVVSHDDIAYHGSIENISLKGAMISFDESVMVPQGDCCALEMHLDGETLPLSISAEVIYSTLYRIGVEFAVFPAGHHAKLCVLMARLTPYPEKLQQEMALLGLPVD